jgi:hypothetical protein
MLFSLTLLMLSADFRFAAFDFHCPPWSILHYAIYASAMLILAMQPGGAI